MRTRLRAIGTLVAAALLVGLAGCASGTVSDPGGSAGSAGGDLRIRTAEGTVRLPEPARRVVSLDWAYTENLRALGVTPVGHAEVTEYRDWVTAKGAALPAKGVTEVGSRTEPSVEQIRALRPDVIVTEDFRDQSAMGALRDIAPVLAFDFTKKPQLATMRKNFTELAKAVGKSGRARQVLDRMDAKLRDVAGRVEHAGKTGTGYAIAQGFTDAGAPTLRLFTSTALAGQVLDRIGLRNAWAGEPDAWGMTTVGVEALTKLPPAASFFYVAQRDDNVFRGPLAENPVWRDLGFVQRDRVYPLDPGTWLFGGPLSTMQIAEEAAAALRI